MNVVRYILLKPLSLIYGAVTSFRNILFDKKILRSHSFPIPVICVGNISAGGTGKTPHVEYLASLLSQHYNVAVLSRGYMRQSKGFRIVSAGDTVSSAGDEPLQIARNLPHVVVAVDRDRVHGITILMEQFPDLQVVIMDDGFQHRHLKAGLNILLTPAHRPFIRDSLLPYGRLRERAKGMSRAEMIISTKNIKGTNYDKIKNEFSLLPHQTLWFSSLEYGTLCPVFDGEKNKSLTSSDEVILVTGIADPSPMIEYLSAFTKDITHIRFGDHHNFTKKDIEKISSALTLTDNKDKIIITTEKDSVRLKEMINIAIPFKEIMYFLPVRVTFLENEDGFINRITAYVRKNLGDS